MWATLATPGMLLRLSPNMTAGPNIIDNISLRARMTYVAHLYKACMKQHHRPLIPALKDMHLSSIEAEPSGEPSNYLIIAKLTGTGEMQLISAINRLGKFAEIMPGVWALRSSVKQAKLRERLRQTVTSADQVMIANASTGRLAWFNLGPEADVHIRRVWDAELD